MLPCSSFASILQLDSVLLTYTNSPISFARTVHPSSMISRTEVRLLSPAALTAFTNVALAALSRRRYNFDYTLKDEIYPPAIISPKADYIPSLRPNSAREIPNFGWINPNGIWGKGIH